MEKPKINPSIFRAYDVRGVYGSDLTEEIMQRIGNCFAGDIAARKIVLGMDGRVSGPSLKKSFIKGVTEAGKDVIDVGVVPRGACLYLGWKTGLPSAYITASHLTKDWNGVKFSDKEGVEFFEEDNNRIRDKVLGGEYHTAKNRGKAEAADSLQGYKKFILSRIKKSSKPLKVVIDSGNGTGGIAAPGLFRELGFSVKEIFTEVDGNFPNRSSEIEEKSLGELRRNMKGNDVGIAYDGDSDRMALMDEKGRLLDPELISHIILQELVKSEKGPIIANVECLKIMDEIARKYGREIFRIRVGNSFLVREVKERKACFGVERSGHFCIPSIIPMDDGIAASLYAASALSRTGKKLSQIVDELPKYPFERVKVSCDDGKKFAVIESLKKRLSKTYERVNTIDGIRVDFEYGWVLIRASNTGPVIRVSAETDNEEKLKKIIRQFLGTLKEEIEKGR